MATALLVQVDQDTTPLLRQGRGMPQNLCVEDAADPELALRRLERDAESVEAVVLGPRVDEPIRLAQRVRATDREVAVLILTDPERHGDLARALRVTPFIGDEVSCLATDDDNALVAELTEAMHATARRRQHRRTLVAAQARLSAAPPAPPRTAHYLGQLLTHAPIGVVTTDTHGTIVAWNPRAAQIFGRGEREVIGCSLLELFPETERERLGRLAARASASDAPPPAETFERYGVGGDRQIVEVTAAAIAGRGGEPASLLLIQDVTERTRIGERRQFLAQAAAALVSSLDYEATLDSIARLAVPFLADWAFVELLQDDGTIKRMAIAHRDPDKEALAKEYDLRYPIDPDATEGSAKVIRTGRPELIPEIPDEMWQAVAQDAEHLRILRDLGFRSAMIVPLVARRRVLGALAFATDAPGRRFGPDDQALAEELAHRAALAVDNARLYREAHEAIRLRDEFLSIASHELRNPVAGISGTAQLLLRADQRGQLDRERLRRYLNSILDMTRRLVTLTEDLLDVSRLRAGELPLRPKMTDLAAVVDAAISRMRASGDLDRIAIHLDCHPCSAIVDPDRMEQVVENLVSNAVKYSPDGGEIWVALARDGDEVVLRVRDAGIGLPSDARERIFEPFGRAPNAVARNIEGLGLGLYICRRIAEQHGGRLWAESPGEGHGTTMILRLPASGVGVGAPDIEDREGD